MDLGPFSNHYTNFYSLLRNCRRIRILVTASSVSIFTLNFLSSALSSATTLCSSFLCLFFTPTIRHGDLMQYKGEGGIIGVGGGHKIKSCYGRSPRGEFMIFFTRGGSYAWIHSKYTINTLLSSSWNLHIYMATGYVNAWIV